jgi:hypothetical protein
VLPRRLPEPVEAHLQRGRPSIYTRRGYDWTLRFRTIADGLVTLPADDLIPDGEAVVADSLGMPHFALLYADLAAGPALFRWGRSARRHGAAAAAMSQRVAGAAQHRRAAGGRHRVLHRHAEGPPRSMSTSRGAERVALLSGLEGVGESVIARWAQARLGSRGTAVPLFAGCVGTESAAGRCARQPSRGPKMEDAAYPLWAVVVIGGPIVLGLVLAFGVIRNRRRRRALARRDQTGSRPSR